MSNMVFCRGCGKEIHTSAQSCPHCGAIQEPAIAASGKKNKIAAALFAIFLGFVGAQKFYLGKTSFGIVCILLTCTFFLSFIPAIIGIVDFIIFLTMSDSDFDKKFNHR